MLHIPGRQAGSLQVPSPWKWDCFLSVAQERYFCVQMNALLGTLSSGISLVVDFAQEWRTLQVIWGRLFCLYLQLRSWLPPLQSRVNINWYEIYQKLPCETRSSSSSVMPMSDRLALTLDTSFSSSNASIRLERLWSGSTSASCVHKNVYSFHSAALFWGDKSCWKYLQSFIFVFYTTCNKVLMKLLAFIVLLVTLINRREYRDLLLPSSSSSSSLSPEVNDISIRVGSLGGGPGCCSPFFWQNETKRIC